MKRAIAGFILGAFTAGTIAFAASYIAEDASFKILVNGEEFTSSKAVVIDGSTYLPLRALGSVLNVPVAWNEELRQVEVGKTQASNIISDAEKVITTKEYIWKNDSNYYVTIVARNNTPIAQDMDINVLLYDENEKMVGAKSDSRDIVPPGCEVMFTFSNKEAFSGVKYEYSLNEKSYYVPVIQNLVIDYDLTEKKAVISIRNNGDIAANFVEAYVIFKQGDKVVGYDDGYVVNSNSCINPGEMCVKEFSCSAAFDSIEVYLSGRGSK